MIVKRAIRGMLSHKKARGKEALKRIKVYEGIPDKFKEAEIISLGKEKQGKFIYVGDLTK